MKDYINLFEMHRKVNPKERNHINVHSAFGEGQCTVIVNGNKISLDLKKMF